MCLVYLDDNAIVSFWEHWRIVIYIRNINVNCGCIMSRWVSIIWSLNCQSISWNLINNNNNKITYSMKNKERITNSAFLLRNILVQPSIKACLYIFNPFSPLADVPYLSTPEGIDINRCFHFCYGCNNFRMFEILIYKYI